ncbi:hypothetical protein EON81_23295 [bacterium]|nr:MAG: hypothetical protein EON81_23295 [bacterium]
MSTATALAILIVSLSASVASAQWSGGAGTIGDLYYDLDLTGQINGPSSGSLTMSFTGFSFVVESGPSAPAGCPWSSPFATLYSNSHPVQTWMRSYYVSAGYTLVYRLPVHEQAGQETRTRTSDSAQFVRKLSNMTNGNPPQGDGSNPYPYVYIGGTD